MTLRGAASASTLVPDVFPPVLALRSAPSLFLSGPQARQVLVGAIIAQFALPPVERRRLPNGNPDWVWQTITGTVPMDRRRPVVDHQGFADAVVAALDRDDRWSDLGADEGSVRLTVDEMFRFAGGDDGNFGPYALRQLSLDGRHDELLGATDHICGRARSLTVSLLRLTVLETMHRSLLQRAIDDAGPAFAGLPEHFPRTLDAFTGLVHLADPPHRSIEQMVCEEIRSCTEEAEEDLVSILAGAHGVSERTVEGIAGLAAAARRRIEAIDARHGALALRFDGPDDGAGGAVMDAFRQLPGDEVLVRRIANTMRQAADERGERDLVVAGEEFDLELAEELLLFGERIHFRGRVAPRVAIGPRYNPLLAAAFVPVAPDAVAKFARAIFATFPELSRRAVLERLATPEGQRLARGVIIAREVVRLREADVAPQSPDASVSDPRAHGGTHPVLGRDL